MLIRIIHLLFAGAVLFACDRADRPLYDSFGSAVSPDGATSLAGFLGDLEDADSAEVKFMAEIDQVCQKKGCWMTLKTGEGQQVRVTFKDYGFFVPKDAGGKEVVVQGIASVSELDPETARHYAEDAGKVFDESAGLTDISVVASGVLIKKDDRL